MREGWVETRLGELFETVNARLGPHTDEPEVFSVTKYDGFVPADEYFGKRIASVKLDTYKVVESDEWAYSTIHIDEGSIARNRLGRPGVVSPMYTTMKLTNDHVHPYYAELLLRSPWMLARYSDAQQGSINRRRSLPWRVFAALTIPLPPLHEQRRIVDLVGAMDDTIAAADRSAEVGLYQALLRQLESSFMGVPIESVVERAFAGGTPSRKQDRYFGGEIPWLKSGEVRQDWIASAEETVTEAGVANSSAKWVPPGATVVAMYGQGDTKGSAGFVSAPITTNQAVLALLPDSGKVDPRYLLHAVRSQTPALRRRAVGAAQPNLSKALVLSHPIPLPELSRQEEIASTLDDVLLRRDRARTLRSRLRTLRSNLLTALLSGEHEIPESYDELMEVDAA